jgi:CheY-like chemotaxis protein
VREYQDLNGSVLIVDDDPGNLKVAAGYLEAQGLEILLAKNGEDGLERARLGMPDLILMDVRMPGMDGYAACRKLKEDSITGDIPVLFLSALDDVTDKLKGFAVGGLDYIAKPIDEAELLARVATHMRLHQLQLQMEEKNMRLRGALDTGNVVNVAVGVLMERHRISREHAFENIRHRARSQRRKVQAVANELLAGLEQIDLLGRETSGRGR